jgi:3-oxoacyl-[acyl-carrier-protein] synthase III
MIPFVRRTCAGQLGIQQTHASYDLIAACAGLPYGLSAAVRLLQEVQRPVLVVCVEKFSDKIGNVRTSRMIFGDGAAAMVVGVAPDGAEPDIEYLQTYASGPASEVNSIIWPNPEFDNNITVYGPEVKSLAGRYLSQMIEEISALPGPDGSGGSLLDSIDLIVPHQANRTMVEGLAQKAGLALDGLYFNIESVGNASSASIPLALHDAVRDGVISSPVRVFAPGFGAGAVAGYSVMRIDPAVVAVSRPTPPRRSGTSSPVPPSPPGTPRSPRRTCGWRSAEPRPGPQPSASALPMMVVSSSSELGRCRLLPTWSMRPICSRTASAVLSRARRRRSRRRRCGPPDHRPRSRCGR